MAKAHDPVAAKAAYKALGLDDPDSKEIDAALGATAKDLGAIVAPLLKSINGRMVTKAQFHIGVGMLGTVTTGFNAENLARQHRKDICGQILDGCLVLFIDETTKVIPFSNIKEIDLA